MPQKLSFGNSKLPIVSTPSTSLLLYLSLSSLFIYLSILVQFYHKIYSFMLLFFSLSYVNFSFLFSFSQSLSISLSIQLSIFLSIQLSLSFSLSTFLFIYLFFLKLISPMSFSLIYLKPFLIHIFRLPLLYLLLT